MRAPLERIGHQDYPGQEASVNKSVGIGLGIVGIALLVVALLQHARIIQIHANHLAVYIAVLGVAALAAAAWMLLRPQQSA